MHTEFEFISWNTQKKAPGRAKIVIKELAARYGQSAVVALQEVPRWECFATKTHTVRTSLASDCAVILPKSWDEHIMWEDHGAY